MSPDRAPTAETLRSGNRRALARAITLIESTNAAAREAADELLAAVLPMTGQAIRLGVSGSPGAGKSTFIEALGLAAIAAGHRVAVLAIDPSSAVSGGSILGDKTRMERLSVDASAYIRPSPSSGSLGGVGEHTREAVLLCEAAGYDVVIVETVGVGQSEIAVAGMTDLFILLQLPNAGDDLQAMKRGIVECADLFVVNKADLDPVAADRAARQFESCGRAGSSARTVSALRGDGVAALWAEIEMRFREASTRGEIAERRRGQIRDALWASIRTGLMREFRAEPRVTAALAAALDDLETGRAAPGAAARGLLRLFRGGEDQ
jgi:LAO/AO transport system kinase